MKNIGYNKGIVFGIIILFIGVGVIPSISGNEYITEQLDQYQTQWDDGGATWWFVQSFKPTLNVLTSVYLSGWRDGNPPGKVWVSIKEDLYGEDLTITSVPEKSIPDIWPPPTELTWTRIDFPDIAVEPEKVYFIVWHVETFTGDDHIGWYYSYYDHYERGLSWICHSYSGESWELMPGDYCFKTYGYNGSNLNCIGDLSWTDVKIGSAVSANFTVENIGAPGSELDWEISEYPSWGTWTFTPENGNDLTPEDGPFTVQVSVIAPSEESLEFHGNIIIRNKEFPNTDQELLTTSLIEINLPPNTPNIDGVTSGNIREAYTYTCSALDPEGKDVYYYIDWGDNKNTGWLGRLPSGEEIQISHTWIKKGNYNVRAKAKDTYDSESDWATLSVNMPRNRATQRPFIQFLEQYPILYQLLQRFLQL